MGLHIFNNISATTNPGVDDDSSAGYREMSIWINTSGPSVWICCDPSDGEAFWTQIG